MLQRVLLLAVWAESVSSISFVHQGSLPDGLVETEPFAPFGNQTAMNGPVKSIVGTLISELGNYGSEAGLSYSCLYMTL